MKKEIKCKQAFFPMPVLLVATFNEDNSVNVMNAAWGMMKEYDEIVLNLTETHKTVKNILARKAFTVTFADSKHVVEADYFGIASGNQVNDKLGKTNLTYTKSDVVDAPIINEFKVTMECEFIQMTDCGVVGKIKRVIADEDCLNDGVVDVKKVDAICFDSFGHGYYSIGEKVGQAYKSGKEIK